MDKKFAVIDFETDPFTFGREPRPFSAGFYDGETYVDFWGPQCGRDLINYLDSLEEPHIIYAHNGGKFDFYYFLELEAVENPALIIGGRITRARMGIHELRDSYAILPIPLSAYSKDEIDYSKFEPECREQHKAEILAYQKSDCIYLWELVDKFLSRFGDNLTIGSTAVKRLRDLHPFERAQQSDDEKMREFYFGGRVEYFEQGILHGDFKVYDVNSMYPAVMRDRLHPNSLTYLFASPRALDAAGHLHSWPEGWPYFITFTGANYGALPTREKTGLNFGVEYGTFNTTSHEYQTALKYGLIRVDKVERVLIPKKATTFAEFVDTYIQDKIRAKREGDKASELFAKLLLNSSYGKTAQNGANYFDWEFRLPGMPRPDLSVWELYEFEGEIELYRKPVERPVYYNVAIGASITGAARAVLLDAIQNATRPVYCDTDSLICERLDGVDLHPTDLGAWDCEAEGDTLAIGGKKLYALQSDGKTVKTATKGARLDADSIFRVAQGDEITWRNDAPSFNRAGKATFIERTIRATFLG